MDKKLGSIRGMKMLFGAALEKIAGSSAFLASLVGSRAFLVGEGDGLSEAKVVGVGLTPTALLSVGDGKPVEVLLDDVGIIWHLARGAVYDRKVEDVEGLTHRVVNVLRRAEPRLRTLGDLVLRSRRDLLRWRGLGRGSLQEIEEALARLGLRLGMTQDDVGIK